MKTYTRPILTLVLWATFSILLHPSLQQKTNPRLQLAYKALQEWKHSITSDPTGFTSNWVGSDVCSYKGVFCAPALDNPSITTVAGIDLNHANIAGSIPKDIGCLLPDLALLHLNSNRFGPTVPTSLSHMKILYELDLSNNLFCGPFPTEALLSLSSLRYLDLRFNHFYGPIPESIFQNFHNLDALFLNNNNFNSSVPDTISNSPLSVLVVANNPNLGGCFPSNINPRGTLQEVILMNLGLKGCLPCNLGQQLKDLTVFDVSFNGLAGQLPESIGEMKSLEQLNVAHNKLSGSIPSSVCGLPKLQNFTFSYNFFCDEPASCGKLQARDDTFNCIANRPSQRSPMVCHSFLSHPPTCGEGGCPTGY